MVTQDILVFQALLNPVLLQATGTSPQLNFCVLSFHIERFPQNQPAPPSLLRATDFTQSPLHWRMEELRETEAYYPHNTIILRAIPSQCRCVHFGRPCYNDVMACSRSVLSHLEAYSAGKSCGLVQDAVLMRCPATDIKGLGDAHGGEKGEHIACKLH